MIDFRPKLLIGVSALALAAYFAVSDAKAATVCNNLAAATIEISDCTVASGNVPTTVNFASGATGTLILNAFAPTLAVTNTVDGEGAVIVSGSVASGGDIGVATAGDLASLIVNDGVTFSLGHNLAATTVTVGQGTSGVLNQSADTLTATTLVIAAGGTFLQSGSSANIQATTTTIATGGTLTLVNQGTGTIQGAGADQGALVFADDYDTDAVIGATSLASVTVNDGAILTLDQNLSATTVTVGSGGLTGIINQSAGTLTATTLAIGAADSFTQSGAGVLNANTTIATGGTLTLVNQGTGTIQGAGAGQGALVFGGNYNTDAALGATSLASITVNDGVTLTLDQNAGATTFTVGTGASGVVNQSAGTITATTLAIAADGTFTQSGSGVINANTTIATGGTLTLVNQGTGTIQGAGVDQGALVFAGNYNTDAALGGTNKLASITVNNGVTLILDQDASASTFTVGEGTSGVLTHSTGTLTATSLVIKSGAIFNQTGAGVIAAATTIQDGGTMNVTNAFTLSGALTVGSGASGTLDLAGKILTTNTFTMLTGSTLKTTINNDVADDAGRVVAAGLATIAAGTTIDITVTGTLTIGQTYIIVSGGSSTMVVPTTITDNSASYNFTASIGGSSLTLTVIAASVAGNYTATTTTSNATAAATTLEVISDAGATGDMATVITAIDGLTGTARGDAIATMISDPSGALIATSLSVQSLSLGVVTSRMAALRSGLSGTSESGVSSGNAYSNSALWGQAFGTTATQDRRKDSDGYDADTAGLAFGGDTLLEDGEWTVGGAYSFAVSNVNNKGSRTGNGSDIKSHQGTLYASLDGDAYYVDVLGSIARNSYETNRQISIGSINRTARGDFNAMQYSAKVGGGYNFPMGDGLTLTPTASLQATRLMLDGYTETGADSLNLAVKSQSYNHVQSGLGVKVSYMVVDYGKERLSASVHATWLYDVKSVRQATTSTFTGGGGSFVTEGPAPARNAANLGASLIFDLGTGLSIAATYDVEIKDQYLGHSATATGRWEF